MQRAPALVNGAVELDADAAGTQLRAVWQSDAEFNKNIGLAYRAFHALADEGDKDRMDDIGNNPLVIRMLAKVGAEMQEDTPAGADANQAAQQVIRDLMKSDACADPKHADHDRVAAQIRAFCRVTLNRPAAWLASFHLVGILTAHHTHNPHKAARLSSRIPDPPCPSAPTGQR
ncbi:MAG: hypothetical protein ACMX3H_17115 [Sodalis sp. (in: enterobacteria)]|uniref:hypothetical protein n=1 Tax=Sodalis sp. (in: enterobacteria) TaxID=1898979 RepID=UPI0039E4D28C